MMYSSQAANNRLYPARLQAFRSLFLRVFLSTISGLALVLTGLGPLSAVRAQSIPLVGSLDLRQRIRAISPAPEGGDFWLFFASPNRVLVTEISIDSTGIRTSLVETLLTDQTLTTTSGLAYHEETDTYFFTTTDGEIRQHQRDGNNTLVTQAVFQLPGTSVQPPQPGNLTPYGITAQSDGLLAVVTDGHVVRINSAGAVQSQFALAPGTGPIPPVGIDFNVNNGRLGIVGSTGPEIHTYSANDPIASMPLAGAPGNLSLDGDFAWDPRNGVLLITDLNSTSEPDLFAFSLTSDPQRWLITTILDQGAGSLRQVLEQSNRNIVGDVIEFDPTIFLRTIRITSELPSLEEGFTSIDGDPSGDRIPDFVVTPTMTPLPFRGLHILSGRNSVRGLAFVGFGSQGITIRGGDRNRIESCFIGVGLNGLVQARRGQHGIQLVAGAENNVIVDCVISGCNQDGIRIENRSHGNVIRGNSIGTDAFGGDSVGLGGAGINIILSDNQRIGGRRPEHANVIVRSDIQGILIDRGSSPGPSRGHEIQGNFIGTDRTGTRPLPNGSDGIRIRNCPEITIGGAEPGMGNSVLFNDGAGIVLIGQDTAGISIRRNVLFRNNQPGFGRFFGAQLHVDAPVLGFPNEYGISSLFVTINGIGIPGATVDLYRTGNPPRLDNSDMGDTAQLLGTGEIDDRGEFRIPVPGALALGSTITAMQTDSSGNTSVFSLNQTVPDLPDISSRIGTVNAGAGPLADVLTINGSSGDDSRTLFVRVGDPLTVEVNNPPSRVGQRSPFVLYVWKGRNRPDTVTQVPFDIGDLVLPGPFAAGSQPQPRLIFNNLGFPSSLGTATHASSPAPSLVGQLPLGVPRGGFWIFQGIIRDDATDSGLRAAVTNAIELVIDP